MTITAERKKEIDFSDPYIDSNQSIAVVKGKFAKLDGNDAAAINTAFTGKKIGVQSGTTGEAWAKENIKDASADHAVRRHPGRLLRAPRRQRRRGRQRPARLRRPGQDVLHGRRARRRDSDRRAVRHRYREGRTPSCKTPSTRRFRRSRTRASTRPSTRSGSASSPRQVEDLPSEPRASNLARATHERQRGPRRPPGAFAVGPTVKDANDDEEPPAPGPPSGRRRAHAGRSCDAFLQSPRRMDVTASTTRPNGFAGQDTYGGVPTRFTWELRSKDGDPTVERARARDARRHRPLQGRRHRRHARGAAADVRSKSETVIDGADVATSPSRSRSSPPRTSASTVEQLVLPAEGGDLPRSPAPPRLRTGTVPLPPAPTELVFKKMTVR